MEEITTRFPERTAATVEPFTIFLSLNTRVPPFDDERVRQAVNYAVDREEIVDIFGGPTQARETCQLLPPSFPSYEPYCPYTSSPAADGEWKAPDLERAQRLIAASGTKSMRITVWFTPTLWPDEVGDYIVSLLNNLGYVANLKTLDFADYFTTIGDSRTRAQIAVNGWLADYPSPSGFFEPMLTCDSYKPRSGANFNLAGFCNARVDSMIARAREASDPAVARDLWTRIDEAIVDRAPLVVLAFKSLEERKSAKKAVKEVADKTTESTKDTGTFQEQAGPLSTTLDSVAKLAGALKDLDRVGQLLTVALGFFGVAGVVAGLESIAESIGG